MYLFIYLFFVFSLILSPLHAQSPKHNKIENLHDHEISAFVEVHLKPEHLEAAKKKWKTCVPQESKSFPEKLDAQLSRQIFSEGELQDLKNCKVGECKHNFLPYEVELFSKIQNEDQLKQQFFSFYQNRVNGLTPMDPRHKSLSFSSKTDLSPFCQNKAFNNLIKNRPLKNKDSYRLSYIRYDKRMRPTTRLLQGIHYQGEGSQLCYAEALIFSNHYDSDRIEIWGMSPEGKIQLLIRHRLDFLHSWWRRTQKPKLQDALKNAAVHQLNAALQCLQTG